MMPLKKIPSISVVTGIWRNGNVRTPTTDQSIMETTLLFQHSSEHKPWYPLRLLSLYRIFIALLLGALFFSGIGKNILGTVDPKLFGVTSTLYLVLAFFWMLAVHIRFPTYDTQAYTQIAGDIGLITLLMHASGGISSGLGILLVVSIAGASLLFTTLVGYLFAALATLAILSIQVYAHLITNIASYSYPQTGALGMALFGTVTLIAILNKRIRESEALATQRELDLANLAQLNEHIIQQMQSGVIVIDAALNIRLINKAANDLLGGITIQPPVALEKVSPALQIRHHLWNKGDAEKPSKIREPGNPFEIQPTFIALGQQQNTGTLIILEDTSSYTRELQDAKLTSLGRLTASIAHEIRNPLSAIQHASQLLLESPEVTEHDKRLSEIITKQSSRVNTIIENIMQLSSRDKITPESLSLKRWLETFKLDFCSNLSIDPETLTLTIEPENLMILIDPSQLYQVLWNLCANSLKYGHDQNGRVRITLEGRLDETRRRAYLDIADQGPGIPEYIQEQIFEPFFSTNSSSSGLGLFIARELCEFNGAEIRYIQSDKGSRFRIKFADTPHYNL